MPSDNIRNIGLLKERFQKRDFLIRSGKAQYQRQTAVQHILIPAIQLRAGINRHEFRKAEWVHMHFIAASSELGDHILGEEAGITSGHIHVHIFHSSQAVQDCLKFPKQLHLVKQHIIHAVVFDLLLQVRIEHIGIAVLLVFISIKRNLNDVAFLYSF